MDITYTILDQINLETLKLNLQPMVLFCTKNFYLLFVSFGVTNFLKLNPTLDNSEIYIWITSRHSSLFLVLDRDDECNRVISRRGYLSAGDLITESLTTYDKMLWVKELMISARGRAAFILMTLMFCSSVCMYTHLKTDVCRFYV